MRLSQLFTKTTREVPAEENATNAQLLIRGGFVSKVMAGVYAFMPLGLRVLSKINEIVREEINSVGGQEILMSVFQDRKVWSASGRWQDASDVMYQFEDSVHKKDYGLGFTHEEPLTAAAKQFIHSYKDLPRAVYQIQTKFRNEPRAKSGLLRGREFLMKDLYSFHTTQEDLDQYYEKVADAYARVFQRVGVQAIRTFASGGLFSKYSDEFQTVTPVGEDTIYINEAKNLAVNKEVYNDEVLKDLGWNKSDLVEKPAVEVGNIFKLGTRFSEALGLSYTDEAGGKHPVIMASYGIGPSRLMGTVVEVSNDEKGIIWPENIAPFRVHLIALAGGEEKADELYKQLGDDVLYDDRDDKTAGEKFADADLIGCPIRIVVSKKTVEAGGVEVKKRNETEAKIIPLDSLGDI